jgi:hypothetical protein
MGVGVIGAAEGVGSGVGSGVTGKAVGTWVKGADLVEETSTGALEVARTGAGVVEIEGIVMGPTVGNPMGVSVRK